MKMGVEKTAQIDPIRIGVIGCGQFMSRQHIQTIARSSHLKLQYICDRQDDEIRRIDSLYPAPSHSTDWREVVASPEVDVVVAGVLPALHPEIAMACIENAKPVYVEKPLAQTARQCLEIERAAQIRNVPVAVGFNRRFAPATDLLFQAFNASEKPVSVTYRLIDDIRVRPPQQNWKKDCRLLLEVVHIFDLLTYLLNTEPVEIFASETRFNDATVLIKYNDGSRATIVSSQYGSLAQPKEHLQAVLDHGAVEMVDFVEFRSYGLNCLPPLARFAGRPYDGCDNSHVEAFANRGVEALLEMRAGYNRAMEDSGVLADSSDAQTWLRLTSMLGEPPLPQINYAPDKGWGRALESFCTAAITATVPRNARALDGHRATACAVAARRSIETGRPVELNSAEWLPADKQQSPLKTSDIKAY